MTLTGELADEALARDEAHGWTRAVVPSLPEARDPSLLAPYAQAYLSNSSVTIRDLRVRRTVGEPVTNGEIARGYLRRVLGGSRERVPWRREALVLADRRPAYYFAGPGGGPWAIVDIHACYATIYSRLTLDTTYRPDSDPPLVGLGRLAFPRRGEWLATKGPRNAAFGNLLRRYIVEYRHGEPVDGHVTNRWYAPDLAALVFDVAHSVAAESIEQFGAAAWAVDGGAIRPELADAWLGWLGDRWGLSGGVRAFGPGWLWGPVSWSVGPVETVDVTHGRPHAWPATDAIRRLPVALRDQLAEMTRGLA